MTTLFDPNTLIETPKTVDPNKDYYAELVGEGKPYKDNIAAGRALAEKDLFISRLEAETKAMRDELAKTTSELKTRTSLDEFLEKVKAAQTKEPIETRSSSNNQVDQTVLSEEKIAEIVETRLTAKEHQAQEARNVQTVQEGLVKAFGNDYVPQLVKKASELGVSNEFLDNLAKTAPRVFFATLGIAPDTKPDRTIFNAPNSTVTGHQSGGNIKNESYYRALRKKLPPGEYWSPAIQNEKFEMATKLGQDFFN